MMRRAVLFTSAPVAMLAALPAWAQDAVEEKSAGLPQFNPHWWPGQIAWLLVIFVVLYAFLAKKTLPEISGTLAKRREKIESDLQMAESLRGQAAILQEQYETLMQKTRVSSTQLMHDAIVGTKQEAEKKFRALQERGAEQMAALEQNLQAVTAKVKRDMQGQIAELAANAAQKIVGIAPDLSRATVLVQSLNGTEAA